MMKPPTIEELADELERAYMLVRHAVPLVLQLLETGKGSMYLQEHFWRSLVAVKLDLLDDLYGWDGVEDPIYGGSSGIDQRVSELCDLRLGQCDDSSHANVA